jgi:hypothetical protein
MKRISRKGAKAQRRPQRASGVQSFAFLLCAFAPLREMFFTNVVAPTENGYIFD